MVEIIPAILPKNYEDLKNKVSLIRGFVSLVQVDICDGIFVPNLTWPFLSVGKKSGPGDSKKSSIKETDLDEHFRNILNEREGMPFWEDMDFELDLMVSDAVENLDIYMKLGAKRIIFHLEAVGDLEEFRNYLEGIDPFIRENVDIGVAINIKTPVEDIFPLAGNIDFIQCMGNDKIGFQGVELDEKIYDKLRILRKKYPDMPLAVDIGVDMESAPLLIEAGATKLVAGSAIFNAEDVIGAIEYFKDLG